MKSYYLDTQLDPLQHITVHKYLLSFRHTPVRQALATLASLVVRVKDETGSDKPLMNKDDITKVLIELRGDGRGLAIQFANAEYAKQLRDLLRMEGFSNVSCNEQGNLFMRVMDDQANNVDAVNALHREIGRFILYVLGTWKIHSHSYLRDVYCDTTGTESGINSHDQEWKTELRYRFDQVHWMHKAQIMVLQWEKALKSNPLAFMLVDGADAYQTVNALIAMQNKLLRSTSNASVSAPRNKPGMRFIDNGDLFSAISVMPENSLVVNAGNAYRIGGAAIYGVKGSIEEMLCRMSTLLIEQAKALHDNDPMKQLVLGLFNYLKPTGKKITLHAGKGIPATLNNVVIDEYLPQTHISQYVHWVTKMLRMSKHLTAESYHQHYKDEKWLSLSNDVLFYQEDGTARSASVINMIGLDGRKPGLVPDWLAFNDEYQVVQDYYANGVFDLAKASNEYASRWSRLFEMVLAKNPKQVYCIAVGAGAFDPGKEAHFTRASANGFAKAYVAFADKLQKSEMAFDFIFRDTQKRTQSTFSLFQAALKEECKPEVFERLTWTDKRTDSVDDDNLEPRM